MPLYICNTQQSTLDSEQKTAIAQSIVDIHCSVTGAPACFVHTVFFEEAAQFPLDEQRLNVRGTIRKGRTNDQKDLIAAQIEQMLVEKTDAEPEEVIALIRETPASWVIEGGEIMPEPGQEAAWLAAQAKKKAGATENKRSVT